MKLVDFISSIQLDTHPSGVPENLVAPYRKLAIEAIIYLQRYIDCFQENNTEVWDFCSAYWNCNTTVIPAPNGPIQRVYSVQSDAWCDQIYYDEVTYDHLLCMARDGGLNDPPAVVGTQELPEGVRNNQKTTDRISGRARHGVFCRHNDRVYVYPWIHSSESVVLEWNGLKRKWGDIDAVSDDEDFARAVKLYITKEMARTYEHDYERYNATTLELNEAVRDLIYDCREKTRSRVRHLCHTSRYSTEFACKRNISIDVPSEPVEETTNFAIVGDFGIPGANEASVANLIKGWNPKFIVALGDNWYDDSLTPEGDISPDSIDDDIGQYFSNYLYPYNGKYEWYNREQRFFAAIGNHDRDPVGKLAISLDYFGRKSPYFDVVKGPCHFIFYDAGYDSSQVNQQPDGIAIGSKQAQWAQSVLANSKSPWKIFILHQPPYTSCVSSIMVSPLAGDGTLSYPALRLPFKEWGVDLVLSGHAHLYERLEVNGLHYIVNGSGHVPASFVDVPLSYSQVRYNARLGAQLCSATCTNFNLSFYNVDGDLIDTLSLEKEDSETVAIEAQSPTAVIGASKTGKNWRVTADGTFEIYNKVSGKWLPAWGVGEDGEDQLELGPGET